MREIVCERGVKIKVRFPQRGGLQVWTPNRPPLCGVDANEAHTKKKSNEVRVLDGGAEE